MMEYKSDYDSDDGDDHDNDYDCDRVEWHGVVG